MSSFIGSKSQDPGLLQNKSWRHKLEPSVSNETKVNDYIERPESFFSARGITPISRSTFMPLGEKILTPEVTENVTHVMPAFPPRQLIKLRQRGTGHWLLFYQPSSWMVTDRTNTALGNRLTGSENEEAKHSSLTCSDRILTQKDVLAVSRCQMPEDVESIKILGKNYTEISDENWQEFVNVCFVDAGDNRFSWIDFVSFASLSDLRLPSNQIRKLMVLPRDAYMNLTHVDLSFNYLKSEDDCLGSLAFLQQLKSLNLSNNKLKSFNIIKYCEEKQVIITFPKLQLLNMCNNYLKSDVVESLAILQNLTTIHLSHNKIESLPSKRKILHRVKNLPYEYEIFPKLKILYLTHNLISGKKNMQNLAQLASFDELALFKNPIAYSIRKPELLDIFSQSKVVYQFETEKNKREMKTLPEEQNTKARLMFEKRGKFVLKGLNDKTFLMNTVIPQVGSNRGSLSDVSSRGSIEEQNERDEDENGFIRQNQFNETLNMELMPAENACNAFAPTDDEFSSDAEQEMRKKFQISLPGENAYRVPNDIRVALKEYHSLKDGIIPAKTNLANHRHANTKQLNYEQLKFIKSLRRYKKMMQDSSMNERVMGLDKIVTKIRRKSLGDEKSHDVFGLRSKRSIAMVNLQHGELVKAINAFTEGFDSMTHFARTKTQDEGVSTLERALKLKENLENLIQNEKNKNRRKRQFPGAAFSDNPKEHLKKLTTEQIRLQIQSRLDETPNKVAELSISKQLKQIIKTTNAQAERTHRITSMQPYVVDLPKYNHFMSEKMQERRHAQGQISVKRQQTHGKALKYELVNHDNDVKPIDSDKDVWYNLHP